MPSLDLPDTSSPLRCVLVVVGGSMAAVKAPSTLRRLREAGYAVEVVASRAALHFITPLSLAAAAGQEIATDTTWFTPRPDAQHLTLPRRADLVLVLGASADMLGQAAHGLAGDLASACLLSAQGLGKAVLWVSAMNESMWFHPAVQHNVATLRGWGQHFLGPEVGHFGTLGEGTGVGRMSEPEQMVDAVRGLLEQTNGSADTQSSTQQPSRPQDMMGLRVVVSAGPTREYLDPVRFISNPSSGKMGFAVAQEARDRGADVTLVTGPVHLPDPAGVRVVAIESALQLYEAVMQASEQADMVVMTAAVADYRAAEPKTEKEPKTSAELSIHLVPNPDILAALGQQKGNKVLVGFAMETHAGVERAAAKAQRKNADFILLNYPTRAGTAFGGDDNQVTLVRPDGSSEDWPRSSKREVARRLLDEALKVSLFKRLRPYPESGKRGP